MTYFNDRLLLITDSNENINLFRLIDNSIIKYYFDNITQDFSENTLAKNVFKEFAGTIDKEDTIYLIYQDMSLNLVLTLLNKEDVEIINLTENPIHQVYYLNFVIYKDQPNIFYLISTDKDGKKYRLYHHYLKGKDWETNIVDDIKVGGLLNPIKVFTTDNELILAYYDSVEYDSVEYEQIYLRIFNFDDKRWMEKIELTNDIEDKLYIDFILKGNELHIAYCQYEEGNLVVIYKKFIYQHGIIKEKIRHKLSNPENPQNPVVLYYGEKLWVVWIEYDNVMSRYSDDMGNSWSPIYLWKESKGKDIVRYEYHATCQDETILNYSFGKIQPEISFIGFGSTRDTTKIPPKKKYYFDFPRI